jgi:hypothetical protein
LVAGSSPARPTSEAIFQDQCRQVIVYSSFMRTGAVQQVRYLGVDATSGHVAVLGHADVAVAEMIGAGPGREPLVVDEGRHSLAEGVGGHLGHPQFFSCRAPFLAEVVRVTKRRGRRGKDDHLLAEVGQLPALHEHVDGELG